MEKKQYWVLLPAVILILAAAVWAFQDTLVMYIAPQIPLSRALESTVVRLDEQIRESPLPIVLRGYDEDGRMGIHAELSDNDVPIGTLQIQSDLEGGQMQLRGAFPEGSRLPSLELYANRDFVAITSDTLLRGGYYGITYETFSQDLQSIPLASLLISPQLRGEWEASVRDLQEKMNQAVSLPAIPQMKLEELRPALLGLWVLRPEVRTVRLDEICWEVSYQVTGETARFLWQKILKAPYTGREEIRLTFYLRQNELVQIAFSGTAGERQMKCALKCSTDALSLDVQQADQGLSLASVQEGEWTRCTICVSGKTYACQWQSQSGDLLLSLPGKEDIALNLSPAEQGFHVRSNDLGTLMDSKLFRDSTWDVTVVKGTEVTAPPYKNMDQWSFEDLLILLNGVWSVFKAA